ncbi:uncharacterized protein LOC130228405 [Danio aesculapii]|uniref:uncharacterized protein LOC130228405 n=1 Tax=Danio aesculapii TaxID=1142201 RepID=UPI0024BFD247|nr:uncharacterized protein LOC130228405 [Danio aesculapii]
MATLIFVYCLLTAVSFNLAVPVEEIRSRKTRDMSVEDFYQPMRPGQSGFPFVFLMPTDQFPGMQLTPNISPNIIRPYSPGIYPFLYPNPYLPPYLQSHRYPYHRYLHRYPHPGVRLFGSRPSVAVQPPIIVVDRVPSPTTVSPTARPQTTAIAVG